MDEELDILQDTTQEGAVFADTTAQADSEEVVDNARYNDEGERLYYWVPPSELGDVNTRTPERALYQDTGGYYTEDEIRAAWDADQGMGYLKEQTDWDNYWGYLTERQDLIDDGTIFDATGADAAGKQNRQDFLNANGGLRAMGGAKEGVRAMSQLRYEGYSDYYQSFLEQPEQMALMSKYGISPVIENNDGDVFGWNGSSYTKVVKVDDHNYGAVVGGLIKSFVIGAITGGLFNEFVSLMTNVGGFVGKAATNIQDLLNMKLPGGLSVGADGAIAAADMAVIVNLTEQGISDALNVTDNQNDDGMTRYSVFDLPPGYIFNEARGVVIHEESGNEYAVAVSPWGALVNLPDVIDESSGGGGAPEDGDPDADGDGVPASVDPDDNDPNNPNPQGPDGGDDGGDTGGDDSVVLGPDEDWEYDAEHPYQYEGNGCYQKYDENGNKVGEPYCLMSCDLLEDDFDSTPCYDPENDNSEVGQWYSIGDEPDPEDEYPEAGTVLSESCDGDDKYIVIADGEGGTTTEIEEGGCAKDPITLGGNPEWETGDNGGGGPKPGDACELSDGTEGTINEEGQCVKTKSGDSGGGITIGTNPEWGGEGDGNGDGNGDGDDDGDEPPPIQFPDLSFGEFEDFQAGIDYNPILPPETPLPQAPDYVQSLDNLIRKLQSERKA
jgi:hypothetical protein